MAECAVCNKKIGGFSGLAAADELSLAVCQKQGIRHPPSICINCIKHLLATANSEEAKEKRAEEQERLSRVKLYTFNPFAPDTYENLGLVTSFMSIGTSMFTEFLSSFTDLVGAESKTYGKKINEATEVCVMRLRDSALDMGADAVIGLQTTFTELTAGQGQILVCMIGTAVKKN